MRQKGKHRENKNTSIILYIVTVCLLISIVGRFAHAKYISEIRQNTFDVEFIAGDIKLELTDNASEFVIVPGQVITKESKVTVKAKSEACYVFVKIEKSEKFENYIEYEVASEWTELTDVADVYYCELPVTTEDRDIYIFNNNQIIVKDTVTEQDLEKIEENKLDMKITGYAVQKTNEIDTANEAWEFIK